MHIRRVRHIIYIAIAIIATSCGVTRHTPEGEYFLQRVKVEADESIPKEERIPAYTFDGYLRQTPNKRLLGANFYVWLYNLANPTKDNAWNRFKRRIGQAPIYYDEELAIRSSDNLKAYMNSQGYYSSEASFSVDNTSRRKRASVIYRVKQNEPYIITSHDYQFNDTLIEGLILRERDKSLIKIGDPFNATTLDKERSRIATSLREKGYFSFSANNIEYLADTLAGDYSVAVTTIIKKYLAGYNERGEAIMEDHTRYKVSDINIIPDFDPTVVMTDTAYLSKVDTSYYRGLHIIFEGEQANVRSNVLRQAVPIYPNTYYNSSLVDETYKNLISIGYFKSAKVIFEERDIEEFEIDTIRYKSTFKIDSALMTTSPMSILSCNVLCTPALTQSVKLEVEGTSTSSFYGTAVTAAYQNRNIFRGAEAFDVALSTGYEFMKSPDATKSMATEIGVTTGLSFPRFLLPIFGSSFPNVIQPRTKLEVSMNYQDRPYYKRTLASASWNYSWRSSGFSSYTIRPIDVNVIDISDCDTDFYESLSNDYLKSSFETQLIAGLSFSYAYNNQLSSLTSNATILRFNVETSGNTIDGLYHLFDTELPEDGTYDLFGIPYAQYVRTDLNVSRKIMLGKVTAIAARFYSGVGVSYGNSEDRSMPYDRMFYVGGSNSMRGWSPRTLGPGGTLEDDSDDSTFPNKVGDLRLEANLELRFPLWDNLHGATFFDLGNVWYMDESSTDDPAAVFHFDSFYEQLGFNTGLGLRLDIKFAIIRLDWGIQLHNPNKEAGERWVTGLKWENTSLNFGVGYPF